MRVAVVQIWHMRVRMHRRLMRMDVRMPDIGWRAGVGVIVVVVVVGVLVIVPHRFVDMLVEVA